MTKQISMRIYESYVTKTGVPRLSIKNSLNGDGYKTNLVGTIQYTSIAEALSWVNYQLAKFNPQEIECVSLNSFIPLLNATNDADIEQIVRFKQIISKFNSPESERLFQLNRVMNFFYRIRFGNEKSNINLLNLIENPSVFAYLFDVAPDQVKEVIYTINDGKPEEFDKFFNHNIAFLKGTYFKNIEHFVSLSSPNDSYSIINESIVNFKQNKQISAIQLQELTEAINSAIEYYKEKPTVIIPLVTHKDGTLSPLVAQNVAQNRQITFIDSENFIIKSKQGVFFNTIASDNLLLITDNYSKHTREAFAKQLAKIRNSNPHARITVFSLTYTE